MTFQKTFVVQPVGQDTSWRYMWYYWLYRRHGILHLRYPRNLVKQMISAAMMQLSDAQPTPPTRLLSLPLSKMRKALLWIAGKMDYRSQFDVGNIVSVAHFPLKAASLLICPINLVGYLWCWAGLSRWQLPFGKQLIKDGLISLEIAINHISTVHGL